jgi:hypothetical protein
MKLWLRSGLPFIPSLKRLGFSGSFDKRLDCIVLYIHATVHNQHIIDVKDAVMDAAWVKYCLKGRM